MTSLSKSIISMPVKLSREIVKRREKKKLKELEKSGSKYFEGRRDIPPLISCRVPERNHYVGQTYSPFKKIPMATEHWQNRGSVGDFFSIVPFHGNYSGQWHKFVEEYKPKLSVGLNSKELDQLHLPSFKNYGFDERIVKTLDKLGFKVPTNIQDASFEKLLMRQSAIIASETGNGKTLAFLLPIIHQILGLKEKNESLSSRPFNSPFCVVLTPGRELAEQIFDVAEKLCADINVNVRLEQGGHIRRKILHGDRLETDILIGSMGGISKMFSSNFFSRDYISTIVLDEADTLVDSTFCQKTEGFLTYLTSPRNKKLVIGSQFLFVSATFPSGIREKLKTLFDFDDFPVIRTHYLHRILQHTHQKFIRVRSADKPSSLLDVIEKDIQKSRPILIFSNKSSTAAFVSQFLQARGIDARLFCKFVFWNDRGKVLDDFMAGKFHVLSCTDLASRGIDTSNVTHVVNYDFPTNVADYIHRAGRVGRIGAKHPSGRVTSLVSGRISLEVVKAIELAVRTNNEVENVDADILKLIRERRGEDMELDCENVDEEEAKPRF